MNVWKSTQTLQPMHAFSTQRKANMGNDVNYFPIEGLRENQGAASSSPFLNKIMTEWNASNY